MGKHKVPLFIVILTSISFFITSGSCTETGRLAEEEIEDEVEEVKVASEVKEENVVQFLYFQNIPGFPMK